MINDTEIIGWKQAYSPDYSKIVIVKLAIHKGAQLCWTKKGLWRTNKATVLSIRSKNNRTEYTAAKSLKDSDFKYVVGEEIESNSDLSMGCCDFCGDETKEQGPGIYFFLSRSQALGYEY